MKFSRFFPCFAHTEQTQTVLSNSPQQLRSSYFLTSEQASKNPLGSFLMVARTNTHEHTHTHTHTHTHALAACRTYAYIHQTHSCILNTLLLCLHSICYSNPNPELILMYARSYRAIFFFFLRTLINWVNLTVFQEDAGGIFHPKNKRKLWVCLWLFSLFNKTSPQFSNGNHYVCTQWFLY